MFAESLVRLINHQKEMIRILYEKYERTNITEYKNAAIRFESSITKLSQSLVAAQSGYDLLKRGEIKESALPVVKPTPF